jgi:hypothetical protein
MKAFWDWLLTWPPVVVAALLGLFGAIGSLWAHRWRERVNRKEEMVREVHFQLAAAYAARVEVLAHYASAEMTDENIRTSVANYEALAMKFHLVANIRGISVLNRLDEKLQEAAYALSVKRGTLIALRGALASTERQLENFAERYQPLVLSGKLPVGSGDLIQGDWIQLQKQKGELQKQVARLSMEALKEVGRHLKEIAPLQISAVLEGRTILGFKIDKEAYRREMESAHARTIKRMEEMIEGTCKQLEVELDKHKALQGKPPGDTSTVGKPAAGAAAIVNTAAADAAKKAAEATPTTTNTPTPPT